MAPADQLVEQMFSWIEQRESCALQLKKLAQELESLREKCNASETVGSTAAVLGAAGIIGAGVVTVLTAGLAVPLLYVGAVSTGVGVVGATVSVVTKITEHFISSDTMKEAQNIEQNSNEIAARIQELFQQLKEEGKRVHFISDPDKLDQYVMNQILGAVARRSSYPWLVNFHNAAAGLMVLNIPRNNDLIIAVSGVLAIFALKSSGEEFTLLIAKGVKKLIKEVSKSAVKAAFKGGAMIVGGAVGMAFALPEAIDNWKDMIKKNHVTEASQSLRDTADAILQMTRTLRRQFDDMEKMLKKLEEEEKLSRKKQEEEEKLRKKQEEEDNLRRKQEEEEKLSRKKTIQERKHST